MKVLTPITITPAVYNFAVAPFQLGDYAEWSAATAYVAGNRVCINAQRRQYQCLVANTNFSPVTNPDKWVDIGATLPWRPFDGFLSSTLTSITYGSVISDPLLKNPGSLYDLRLDFYAFPFWALGSFDAIAVMNTTAAWVRVVYYNRTGAVTYDKKIYSVDTSVVIDASSYCFNDQATRRDFIFDGIDGWGTTTGDQVHVLISNGPDGTLAAVSDVIPVAVGEIIIGEAHELGACHADAAIQLIDYSKKEIDVYGTVKIVQRAYSLNGSFEIEVPTANRPRIQNLMASLRATPCVYFPSEFDANAGVVIYGYVKDYNTTYSTPERAYASLEVEGMI